MTINNGNDEYRAIVSIPFMKEFKALKQQVLHYSNNGTDAVKVVDKFDEEISAEPIAFNEVIQTKSSLEVNVNDYDLSKLEERKKNETILKELQSAGKSGEFYTPLSVVYNYG